MDIESPEQILANAASLLIRNGEREAARALLSCSLQFAERENDTTGDWEHVVVAQLTGPEEAGRLLAGHHEHTHPYRRVVMDAIQRCLPWECLLYYMAVFPGVNTFDPTWRDQLLAKTYDTNVDNQGVQEFDSKIVLWNALRFRSESERRIAAALDAAGVLYLPNCRARVGAVNKRLNREADFLICHEGKWGILEIDGEPFHPPSRKAQEDERDRLFKQHGIRVVEHFDAKRCYETPTDVVKEFLAVLRLF